MSRLFIVISPMASIMVKDNKFSKNKQTNITNIYRRRYKCPAPSYFLQILRRRKLIFEKRHFPRKGKTPFSASAAAKFVRSLFQYPVWAPTTFRFSSVNLISWIKSLDYKQSYRVQELHPGCQSRITWALSKLNYPFLYLLTCNGLNKKIDVLYLFYFL